MAWQRQAEQELRAQESHALNQEAAFARLGAAKEAAVAPQLAEAAAAERLGEVDPLFIRENQGLGWADLIAKWDAKEEQERLLPVLEALRRETDVPLSVDTQKAAVARHALAGGADIINDISALGEPGLAAAVAEAGCPVVLMHSRGEIRSMQRDVHFDDLLEEVAGELAAAVERAEAAGISRDRILLDPGIGFGKNTRQNLLLLRHLDRLRSLGFPLLVGASRKSFIGAATGAPPQSRLGGSLAAVAWAVHHRAAVVRVHDVEETVQFLRVWSAIDNAEGGGE